MWKVFFEEVEVFSSKSDVEAVQFALSLHQASNISHSLTVQHKEDDESDWDCVCQLDKI